MAGHTMIDHHALYMTIGEMRQEIKHLGLRLDHVEAKQVREDKDQSGGIIDIIRKGQGLKEWAFVLSVGLLALKGALSPAEMKELIFKYFGG